MRLRSGLMGAICAAALAIAGQASAANLFNVTFTADTWSPYVADGPWGISPGDVITGSFSGDRELIDFTYTSNQLQTLSDLQVNVGSRTFTLADLDLTRSSVTFSGPTIWDWWFVFKDPGFNVVSASNIALGADGKSLYVNRVQKGGDYGVWVPIPEPATWAMMLLGFFGLGAALRTRRSGAVA